MNKKQISVYPVGNCSVIIVVCKNVEKEVIGLQKFVFLSQSNMRSINRRREELERTSAHRMLTRVVNCWNIGESRLYSQHSRTRINLNLFWGGGGPSNPILRKFYTFKIFCLFQTVIWIRNTKNTVVWILQRYSLFKKLTWDDLLF